MGPLEMTVLVVAFAGLIAWVLRALEGDRDEEVVSPDRTSVRDWDPDLEEDAPEAADEVAVMTSDGWAFVPMGDGLRLIPPREPAEVLPATDRRTRDAALAGSTLDVGDLIAARVVRGAPDHDPWRIEALGRDRDLRSWRFETEEAARAAHTLFSARIVRPPLDQDGEPVSFASEDFEAALREQDEIERELAMGLAHDQDEHEGRPS